MITEICKDCGIDMVPIVYDYPTPALLDMQKDGLIKLAGHYNKHYKPEELPTHFCNSCLYAFPD